MKCRKSPCKGGIVTEPLEDTRNLQRISTTMYPMLVEKKHTLKLLEILQNTWAIIICLHSLSPSNILGGTDAVNLSLLLYFYFFLSS